MKTNILILTSLLFFVGCTPTYTKKNDNFLLPPELSDCKIYYLNDKNGSGIYITRCPSSTTTTSTTGKNPQTVTVIEE